jgi:hypothetical protein
VPREAAPTWWARRRTARQLHGHLADPGLARHVGLAFDRVRRGDEASRPLAALVSHDEVTVLSDRSTRAMTWTPGERHRLRVSRDELSASTAIAVPPSGLALLGMLEDVPETVCVLVDLSVAPRLITMDGDGEAAAAFAAALSLQLFDGTQPTVVPLGGFGLDADLEWAERLAELESGPADEDVLLIGAGVPPAIARRVTALTDAGRARAILVGRPVDGRPATFTVTRFSAVFCPDLDLVGVSAHGLGEALAAATSRPGRVPAGTPRSEVPDATPAGGTLWPVEATSAGPAAGLSDLPADAATSIAPEDVDSTSAGGVVLPFADAAARASAEERARRGRPRRDRPTG